MSFKEFVSKVRRVDETLLLGGMVLALVLMLAFLLQQASNSREKVSWHTFSPSLFSSRHVAAERNSYGRVLWVRCILEGRV